MTSQLIAGQGTLGLEVIRDWPEVEVVVVPIGGGGLISGVSMAIKALKPSVKIIGVESSGAPGDARQRRGGAPSSLSTASTASSTACASSASATPRSTSSGSSSTRSSRCRTRRSSRR